MRHVRAALARIAGVFTAHRADTDLHDELQAHLEPIEKFVLHLLAEALHPWLDGALPQDGLVVLVLRQAAGILR